MKKILFITILTCLIALFNVSCRTQMIPAEDIIIFETCKKEIAILQNPRIPRNSKEKYDAAISISNKVDFSYTRTIDFLGKVFLETDASTNRIDNNLYAITIYYQYKNSYISFEFQRYKNDIISANIRRK